MKEKEMKKQKMMKQVNDSNRIILEKTYALAQAGKLVSRFLEKDSPVSESNKKIINKPGKIFKRDYKSHEVSSEHIMTLYRIANQEI
ncbi:MAG: hypothetical protein ABFD50_09755 [Smithella sp.]